MLVVEGTIIGAIMGCDTYVLKDSVGNYLKFFMVENDTNPYDNLAYVSEVEFVDCQGQALRFYGSKDHVKEIVKFIDYNTVPCIKLKMVKLKKGKR